MCVTSWKCLMSFVPLIPKINFIFHNIMSQCVLDWFIGKFCNIFLLLYKEKISIENCSEAIHIIIIGFHIKTPS